MHTSSSLHAAKIAASDLRKAFPEFQITKSTVRKKERFQWLPPNEEERFLQSFDQHWKCPTPSPLSVKFRVCGESLVFLDRLGYFCYSISLYDVISPGCGSMAEFIFLAVSEGYSQVFPSIK